MCFNDSFSKNSYVPTTLSTILTIQLSRYCGSVIYRGNIWLIIIFCSKSFNSKYVFEFSSAFLGCVNNDFILSIFEFLFSLKKKSCNNPARAADI
jgi:hypothetical protein